MTGHIHATGLYGAPKLLWKPAQHPNPNARVTDCKETRCGTYRTYQQGKFWHGVYLPDPTHWSSIGIERTEQAVIDWVNTHHVERCRKAVQAQETPGTGLQAGTRNAPPRHACGPITEGERADA